MGKKKGDKLTHKFVKNLREEGRHGDGRGGFGLSILVRKTANGKWSKTWSQRLHIGKAREEYTPGLGSFPLVSLADAREKAFENARLVKQGIDIRKPAAHVPTLAEAFEAVIALKEPGWRGKKTKSGWNRSLVHCKKIASIPISEITSADVLKVISPLWNEKGATANKVLSHLVSVMTWSIAEGYRTTNPASNNISSNLSKRPPAQHHESLPHPLLGGALATIRDSDAWWSTKYCLLLLAFTGLRSREAREATWDEIDLETSTWTVPADHMKAGIEHRVPLSTQAKQILHHAREQSGRDQGLIFPAKGSGKYIDSGRLSQLLFNLHIQSVPHGFRSSLRTWAAEKTSLSEPAAEMLLAHTPASAVVKSYQASDFFEMRQPVMQQWADYLTETMGHVISTTPEVYRDVQQERKEEANSPVRTSKAEAKEAVVQADLTRAWRQSIMPGLDHYMTARETEKSRLDAARA